MRNNLGPASSPESVHRRPDFLGGLPIRLADGQDWAFAGPRELSRADESLRGEIHPLLGAIAWAEDEADRLRGELALAVALLAANYDLSPADYERLLDLPPVDPRLPELRIAFRGLALRHAEALRPRDEAPPAADHGRRFRLPAFRPLRAAREYVARSRKVG